mgnify:CR=1 FL=1
MHYNLNYDLNSSSMGECAGVEPTSILWYRNPVFKHSHPSLKLYGVAEDGLEPPTSWL